MKVVIIQAIRNGFVSQVLIMLVTREIIALDSENAIMLGKYDSIDLIIMTCRQKSFCIIICTSNIKLQLTLNFYIQQVFIF